MPHSDASPAADTAATARRAERRAYVRLAVDLTAVCRTAGRLSDIGWPGLVRNISRGGVGLIVRHRFQPGTRLTIDLQAARGEERPALAVLVVHATPASADGAPCWLLGCAFDRPLTEEEFQALL
jgi:hypothetical protein